MKPLCKYGTYGFLSLLVASQIAMASDTSGNTKDKMSHLKKHAFGKKKAK